MLNLNNLVCAMPSCDFMGISVGDEITYKQIMEKLGIKNYKILNADNWTDEKHKLIMNSCGFSITLCREILDENEGNYCHPEWCKIVKNFYIANSVPANVSFIFDPFFKSKWKFDNLINGEEKKIKSISITFNTIHWDNIKKILFEKYGNDWKTKKWQQPLKDGKKNQSIVVEEEEIIHNQNGYNNKFNTYCEIGADKYDQYIHSEIRGKFQSVISLSYKENKF